MNLNDMRLATVSYTHLVTNTAIQDEFKLCNAYARPNCKDCWAKLYCFWTDNLALAKFQCPTDTPLNHNSVSYTHLDVYKRQAFDNVGKRDASVKEVFGSVYGGEGITFDKNGLFSDNITQSEYNLSLIHIF